MISITLVTALALAAAPPTPGASVQARKAYSACLQKLIKAKTEAKLDANAFAAEAKTGCAAEEAALVKSLVDYDIAMGSKRVDAEDSAKLQVEDYLAGASDTYATYVAPN
ncbi:hypothetical protein [Allosphingosinicella deserti]|uniref:Uncharacterized protein n=1 Tax=Allosphingosinicella deserti TaxID=2116704 RepID=A0A2P7QYG0_9SPHN|nr:hypothetical protein [Sphingomonas deserti]PSJ43008.1 hypothetical protein C7I55_00945 [Sphingomonas deserti]